MTDAQRPFEGACVGCEPAVKVSEAAESGHSVALDVIENLAAARCDFTTTGRCAVASQLVDVALQPESVYITSNKD